jgi:hypothetical protein
MKTFTVTEIVNASIDNTLGHMIYLVRDGDLIFYIGQSKRNIIIRFQEHLQKPSRLGQLIQVNQPASDKWVVEFYTLADCRPFIQQKSLFPMQAWEHFDMDIAEKGMIQALRPVVNKDFNHHPTPLPLAYHGHNLIASVAADFQSELDANARIWMNKMSMHGWVYDKNPQTNQIIWQHPSGITLLEHQAASFREAGTVPPIPRP